MTATIAERVAAGAKFLDEHDRDWWKDGVKRAIDLDKLAMGNGNKCILGRRCPIEVYAGRKASWMSPYYAWAFAIAGADDPIDSEPVDRWAAERGFQLSFEMDVDGYADSFEELTAEWARVIRERRSA